MLRSAFSWQNSISLCPASFCTPRPNLPVTPRCFLTSYFCIPVPYNEKDIFFWVLVLEGLVCLHRTVQLQLLQHYWSGHRLGLPDIEWFALETNRDHSVVFETAAKNSISDSVFDYEGYSISSKRYLLNSPIPFYFSSLIPKILIFNLSISCLTMSNLP